MKSFSIHRPTQLILLAVGLWLFWVSFGPCWFLADAAPVDQNLARAQPLESNAPIGRVAPDRQLDILLGLPLRNQAHLNQVLESLYNPGSPSYRKYLTPPVFADQFGPTPGDYEAVIQFAAENGLTVIRQYPNRTLLHVRGRVDQIESALQTQLFNYQHPTEDRVYFAPSSPPKPKRAIPFSGVSGLSNKNPPRPTSLHPSDANPGREAAPANGSDPSGHYIGTDFRNAYLPGVTLNGAGQQLALVEFDGYYTNDISLYLKRANLGAVPLTNVISPGYTATIGGNNIEVALDIEMAICMAPGLSSILIYEGDFPADVLNQIAVDGLANQISCSWYWTDPSEKPLLLATFLQYAAQGQTFLTASGDSGAWLSAIPDPMGSPWVTDVGGTSLSTTTAGGPYLAERVWNWSPGNKYASGGGINPSNALPSWQATVGVAIGGASLTGRNLPDVALTADNISVNYGNGKSGGVGGTSAAAPLWAGFIALVNQQSAAAGLAPIGFINPILYQIGASTNYSQAFHDITVGNNSLSTNANQPYQARIGYDLCTGWGSPRGTSFIDLLSPPAPPTIQSNSSPQQWVLTGGTAQFSITVTGTSPFSFFWQTGGNIIPGATNPILTLTNVQPSQVGDYWVIVTNIAGAVTNFVGTLTVPLPPSLMKQPGSLTVTNGDNATFSVVASGYSPITFLWRRNRVPISGANSNTYILSSAQSSDSGAQFDCVLTNIAGSITSQAATLMVVPTGGQSTPPADSNVASDVPLFSFWHWAAFAGGLVAIGGRFKLYRRAAHDGSKESGR